MSWSADIADAIIALDTAVREFDESLSTWDRKYNPKWQDLKETIEALQATAIGDEGQHFDSLEEARQSRAPRCWGTNSAYTNYVLGTVEFYKPTCGNTDIHSAHVI